MPPEFPPHPRCGLPVLRLEYNEERDEHDRVVEPCGEQLYLEEMQSNWISDEGLYGPDSAGWKLTCVGGHVLMVPDDQGNEHLDSMPFHWPEAEKAVGHLLAHNDGPECGS